MAALQMRAQLPRNLEFRHGAAVGSKERVLATADKGKEQALRALTEQEKVPRAAGRDKVPRATAKENAQGTVDAAHCRVVPKLRQHWSRLQLRNRWC